MVMVEVGGGWSGRGGDAREPDSERVISGVIILNLTLVGIGRIDSGWDFSTDSAERFYIGQNQRKQGKG